MIVNYWKLTEKEWERHVQIHFLVKNKEKTASDKSFRLHWGILLILHPYGTHSLTIWVSEAFFKLHAVNQAGLLDFSLFIREMRWTRGLWTVFLPSHMSRDYTMKQEPSALPRGSVSQWFTERGWIRWAGVSVGPQNLYSSLLMEAEMVSSIGALFVREPILVWVIQHEKGRWDEGRWSENLSKLPERGSKVDLQMISSHSMQNYI